VADDLRQRELEIDRFWNALITGSDPAGDGALDEETAEQIRRLHTLTHGHTPPGAQARLYRALDRSRARSATKWTGTSMNGIAIDAGPFPPGLPGDDPASGSRRRAFVAQAARRGSIAAAAALLVVVVGYLLYVFYDSSQPAAIPPVQEATPSTPSPELGTTVLFDVVFPADVIPAGEGRLTALYYGYAEPGSDGQWFARCCPGVVIEHLVAGEMAFTSTGPMQVLRAGGTLAQIAAETAVLVGPGDTLITRNEDAVSATNTGATTAEFVEWIYLDDPDLLFAGHQIPGWGGPGGLAATTLMPSFPGDIRVTLQRLVLAPDDGQSEPLSIALRLVAVPNLETDILRYFGDEAFVAVDSQGQPTTVYTLEVLPFSGADPDAPIVGKPSP
jgi:hypothetical protein